MEDKITTYKNKDYTVLQYLPARQKSAIFKKLREKCKTDGHIDYPVIDALFNILLVLSYTEKDSDKKTGELLDIYDSLEASNQISLIINQIPVVEYEAMLSYLNNVLQDVRTELMEN